MDVVVAGGHGRIGLRLLRLLAARGDRARGLIRDRSQLDDLEAVGAQAVVCDMERADDLSPSIEGADAVVFAAGAGPGSGPQRKRSVDLGAAVKLIGACRDAGVGRYVMVSAIGVGKPGSYPDSMRPYYEAKEEADAALAEAGLEHTIVRPGRLSDEPGTGLVELGVRLERGGQVSRDDVAATIIAVLDDDRTTGLAFDLLSGTVPIAEAIEGLISPQGAS